MSGIKGINAGKANWNYKHGETHTRLFKIWSSMHERCERQKRVPYGLCSGTGLQRSDSGVKQAVKQKGWLRTIK